jgi:hypothetical protein
MGDETVHRFVYDNNLQALPRAEPTHLTTNLRIAAKKHLRIDDDDDALTDGLLRAIVADKGKASVCEYAGDAFRMFVEIRDAAIGFDPSECCEHLRQVLADFYPHHHRSFAYVVLKAPEADDRVRARIVLPDLIVSATRALTIHARLVSKLQVELRGAARYDIVGETEPRHRRAAAWSRTLPNGVYWESEVLMPYCGQYHACPRHERSRCPTCLGTGHVHVAPPLELVAAYDREGDEVEFDDDVALMRAVSIRTPAREPTAGWTEPRGYEPIEVHTPPGKKPTVCAMNECERKGHQLGTNERRAAVESDDTLSTLVDVARSLFPRREFRGIYATSAWRKGSADKYVYRLNVAGPFSYDHGKKGRLCFEFTKKGVALMCYTHDLVRVGDVQSFDDKTARALGYVPVATIATASDPYWQLQNDLLPKAKAVSRGERPPRKKPRRG